MLRAMGRLRRLASAFGSAYSQLVEAGRRRGPGARATGRPHPPRFDQGL